MRKFNKCALLGLLATAAISSFAADNESPIASPAVQGMPIYSQRIDMVQNMPNVILFALYDDKPFVEFEPLMKLNAAYMASESNAKIKIVGYADDYKSHDKNQELAMQRAQSVRNILTTDFDVQYEDTEVVSMGDTKPFITGKKGVHDPRNRRVEIYYTNDAPQGYHFDKVPVIKIDNYTQVVTPMNI
jgi:outer membrane protein OmpA-like peptidoglycan-associated protein